MRRPRWGIDWDGPRAELADWRARLSVLAPPSDTQPSLHIYWEPGERWCPIERFVIGSVTPRSILKAEHNFYVAMGETDEDFSLYAELEGPSPRSYGAWDPEREKMVYQGDKSPNITQRQWLLYREVGGLVTPIWILQGSKGGHPRRLTKLEELHLKIAGKPSSAPAPGDLPYAPFDNRALDALHERDRMRAHRERYMKDWQYRTSEDRKREAGEREAEYQATFDKWWGEQMEETAEDSAAYDRIMIGT